MSTAQKLKIQYIDPHKLIPNPWNPNRVSPENEAKLMESLKRNDLFDAILARELDDGVYQILGGEHRTKIAKKIGIKEMPVIVLKNIPDDKAKEISMTANDRYGTDDTLKLSELINSLENPGVLVDFMPISEIEIETLLSATKIDMDTLIPLSDDDIDIGELEDRLPTPKTHTIMRFKVSLEDAATLQELIKDAIKTQGFTESDALTNAGDALVHLLL